MLVHFSICVSFHFNSQKSSQRDSEQIKITFYYSGHATMTTLLNIFNSVAYYFQYFLVTYFYLVNKKKKKLKKGVHDFYSSILITRFFIRV